MGLLGAALGNPYLKGDTEGKVSDAHESSKKDIFKVFGLFYERYTCRLIWAPLLFCLVIVENLNLVWFRI